MRESWEEAYFRDMAAKCRELAARLIDERAASSLLSPADEYEAALKAELEFNAFNGDARWGLAECGHWSKRRWGRLDLEALRLGLLTVSSLLPRISKRGLDRIAHLRHLSWVELQRSLE